MNRVTNWEMALRREALAGWRDRQILSACRLFNREAGRALAAFDGQIGDAGIRDTVWDPASFVSARIDHLLCESMPVALREFLAEASRELAQLDPTLQDFADALARSDAIAWPKIAAPIDTPVGTAASSVAAHQETLAAAGSFSVLRTAAHMAEQAGSALSWAGSAASRTLQDRAGLFDRLRVAASKHVQTRWMGGTGDPRPVLAQVIAMIDTVAAEARMSTL